MRGNKAKIQITESSLKNLFFTDIYLPVADDPEDPPELVITHHENYIHIMFATQLNPAYIYKGEKTLYSSIDDKLFGNLDVEDFFKLNESELS